MRAYVKSVSFVAQPNGQPFDFKNLFTLLSSEFELDKDFDFSRKPTVDYFYSRTNLVAEDMLTRKSKKGKAALAVSTQIDIGKIELCREGATTFTTIADKVKFIKVRHKVTTEENLISVGSRTADFWYTATTNLDGISIETIQVRPPFATKVRELLLSGELVVNIFDSLMQEMLGMGIQNNPTDFNFLKDTPTRKPKASEAAKQAQSLARRLYNYWIDEQINILDEVCTQAAPILETMIADEMARRASTSSGPGNPGHLGEEGPKGEDVIPILDIRRMGGYYEVDLA